MFFIPFILLGLWSKFLIQRFSKNGMLASMIIFVFLFSSSAHVISLAARPLLEKNANDGTTSILGETVLIADYLKINSGGQKQIYIEGDRVFLSRFLIPLTYLLERSGIKLLNSDGANSTKPGVPIFHLANSELKKNAGTDQINGREIIGIEKFNRIIIFILKSN